MAHQTSQAGPSGSSPISLSRRFESIKTAVLDILNDTTWPPGANNIARDFSQALADASSLKNIPEDASDATIPKPAQDSLEHLIQVMEGIKPKLEKISNTYGERDRDLGAAVVHSLKSLNKSRCPNQLARYQHQVEAALASLPPPDGWIRQPTSAEGQPNPSTEPTITASAPPSLQILAANGQHRSSTPTTGLNPAPPTPAVQQPSPSGLGKGDGLGKWLGPIKTTLEAVEGVSGALPVVGSYIGAAAKVGKIVVQTIQNVETNESARSELQAHASQLSQALNTVPGQKTEERKAEIEAALRNVQRALQDVRETTKRVDSENAVKKALFADDHREALKDQKEKVRTALEVMDLLLQLDTTKLVTELYDSESRKEQQRLLDRLGDAEYGMRGASIQDAVCLPGTRVTTLERMDSWIRSRKPEEQRVLWIRGMAGRGKSTVASTVLEEWRTHAACAIFHFRRGENARDKRLVCALARQLGGSHLVPDVKDAILGSIHENQDIAQERLSSQFQALLVTPLSRLQNSSTPILLIVDALDECEDETFAVEFVKLIDKHSSSWPTNVKFLLTTRPKVPLLRALEPRQWNVEDLDSTPEVESHRDIGTYMKSSLSAIGEENDLGSDWPPPGSIHALVTLSEGLFQWANTAIKYVKQGLPDVCLQELLDSSTNHKGLDGIYRHILSQALNNAGRTDRKMDLFLSVLRVLVIAPFPISLDGLSYILADHPMFSTATTSRTPIDILRFEALGDLKSMVLVPSSTSDPVRLMHTSIRDLLTSEERCAGATYFVHSVTHHRLIALRCLRLMQRDLKTNICQLLDLSKPNSDPEVQQLVRDKLHQGLQYCCRSLSLHLAGASTSSSSDLQEVAESMTRFSEDKLLGWLEVMSVTEKTEEAMEAAKQIHEWVQKYSDSFRGPSVTALWSDLSRFISTYFEPIHFGALHIYASALPVDPTATTIWKQYATMQYSRILNGPRRTVWPSTAWTGYTGGVVRSLGFSLDGKRMASGSPDETIRMWDTQTGAPIGEPLRGHTEAVTALAFSPDGKRLASGSWDKTLRMWDAETGAPIGEPLRGHTGPVYILAFSPGGKRLASGSPDNTLRMWDAETEAPIGEPLRGHTGSVYILAFSLDGKRLASGSSDKTLRMWDAETGAPIGEPLRGHTGSVYILAFSPDGKRLASGSSDKTLRMWDAETGAPIGEPLRGHTGSVLAVVFSPDGKRLASRSEDEILRMWDAETGAPIGEPLRGHTGSVYTLAFSPDGKRLASGSEDNTLRMWDAETGAPIGEPLRGHTGSVYTLAFSPDGKRLTSGSEDKTLRMWDAETGAPIREPLRGHTGYIDTLAFSPDGKRLASGSEDRTLRMWNAETAAPIGEPLRGYTGYVDTPAFSPDGKRLASGSEDETLRMWDAETGAPIGEPVRRHTGSVYTLAFSPDGKRLASGSRDETLRMWGAETGAPIGEPLRGHTGSVLAVAFSPDGKRLASGSWDKTLRMWDAETGAPIGEPLRGHTEAITTLVFSPDGKRLASGFRDETLRMWDAETGAPIGEPLRGQTESINPFASFVETQCLFPLSVPPPGSVTPPTSEHPQMLLSRSLLSSSQPLTLTSEGQWVMNMGKRILWLPPEYWHPSNQIILLSRGTLALTCGVDVFILDLSGLIKMLP